MTDDVVVKDELRSAIEARSISIPLFALAAIFTGLAGVIVVCVALTVIAVVSSRS